MPFYIQRVKCFLALFQHRHSGTKGLTILHIWSDTELGVQLEAVLIA